MYHIISKMTHKYATYDEWKHLYDEIFTVAAHEHQWASLTSFISFRHIM